MCEHCEPLYGNAAEVDNCLMSHFLPMNVPSRPHQNPLSPQPGPSWTPDDAPPGPSWVPDESQSQEPWEDNPDDPQMVDIVAEQTQRGSVFSNTF